MEKSFSRRELMAGVAASPILPLTLLEPISKQPDAELIALGGQFDELAGLLDRTDWADDAAVAKFAAVEKAILDREAVTLAGLSVKSRAACWALLGDLDPSNGATTDKRMAISIVRDLIRVHAPHLEQPGALTKLVADVDAS